MSLLSRLDPTKNNIPVKEETEIVSPPSTPVVLKSDPQPQSINTRRQFLQMVQRIHKNIIQSKLLKKDVAKCTPLELIRFREDLEREIPEQIKAEGLCLSSSDKTLLIQGVVNECLGFGPIQPLLDDPTITEIMVNGPNQVYVERKGKLILSEVIFINDAHVRRVIDSIVSRIGRKVDENNPLVDARLPDGSRFNAIIPPLALKGSTVTIRKFSKEPFRVVDLINFGSFDQQAADFLRACVEGKLNTIISGGTGSGKTTLLNVLSGYIPDGERIVTVEDAAELKLNQTHVISLESKPSALGGKGGISIRDLVRNSLRMRPDRIIVGECRGGEALDMLQAMNTGHDGSMTTGHANSPADILTRLETMVLMSGMDLPVRAIREQIASAVTVVVQQSRLHDGSRKVMYITEILRVNDDGQIETRDIFRFKQCGVSSEGKIQGVCVPTGYVPTFLNKLSAYGIQVSPEFFQENVPSSNTTGITFPQNDRPVHSARMLGAKELHRMELVVSLHKRLIEYYQLNTESFDQSLDEMSDSKLAKFINHILPTIVAQLPNKPLLSLQDAKEIVQMLIDEIKYYGPLTALLNHDQINEIFVNGARIIYTRTAGLSTLTDLFFHDDNHLRRIITKIVSSVGRRCDESSPMVDARLPDGSGFNAIIPPLSLIGAAVTIRKFSKEPLTDADLIRFGTMDARIRDFLRDCIKGMLNIVIFGGTGSGKTSLLNVLSSFIPNTDRIVTMEETAELRLQQDHVVPLETRPPNIEGTGEIPMQALVKNALRMRPERIIIGEITGGEALDMLQAMNTGHDGSLATGHANTPEDMLSRIETMVLMSGYDFPVRAIRDQVASAIDLLIQQATLPDKSKKIIDISEVSHVDQKSGRIVLNHLFTYDISGRDEEGHIQGQLKATGLVPGFLGKIRLNGVTRDESIFTKEE